MQEIFERAFTRIKRTREAWEPRLALRGGRDPRERCLGDRKVRGLPGVGFEEVLRFPDDSYGIAFNIEESEIRSSAVVDDYSHLHTGDEVERTGKCSMRGGGHGIDRQGHRSTGPTPGRQGDPHVCHGVCQSSAPAPAVIDRAPVTVPLQTGIKAADALIPIGRGQRELILGDRQTGKTAIALDTILNQRGENVICVYCAIGGHAAGVAKSIGVLRESGALDYTVVVVSEGNAPPGLIYIAPYAATSIAEFFVEQEGMC